jgi:hypothetical protein
MKKETIAGCNIPTLAIGPAVREVERMTPPSPNRLRMMYIATLASAIPRAVLDDWHTK